MASRADRRAATRDQKERNHLRRQRYLERLGDPVTNLNPAEARRYGINQQEAAYPSLLSWVCDSAHGCDRTSQRSKEDAVREFWRCRKQYLSGNFMAEKLQRLWADEQRRFDACHWQGWYVRPNGSIDVVAVAMHWQTLAAVRGRLLQPSAGAAQGRQQPAARSQWRVKTCAEECRRVRKFKLQRDINGCLGDMRIINCVAEKDDVAARPEGMTRGKM